MVGKIHVILTQYYDLRTRKNKTKARPALIIGEQRNNDYTVLPISSVSKRENLDADYDVEISPQKYPRLNIDHTSYVRTHKQLPVHRANVGKELSDMKGNYPNLFLSILEKRDQWNNLLSKEALD